MTPDLPRDETARDRAAGAWLTQTQQDLLAPAHALRERAAMLTEDVQPHGPRGLYGDLLTIQAVGQHLEDLINDLIPTLTDPAKLARDAEALTRLRHDLRTPLHQIIGYCDLWLEDEDEAPAVDRFRADLESLRATGRELNSRIEKLRALDPDRAEPVLSEADAAMVQQMVENWAANAPLTNRPEIAPGRLLVVDDNDFNRDVLARRLERQGHTVVQAIHGKHALDLLGREPFDVILLDILMPEMNGLEALERIKGDERLRHLPVIMISALNDIDGVAHCLTMGADDYLPRPYNQAILRARIEALLERKRLRDREVEYLAQIQSEKSVSMRFCMSSCRTKWSANCKRPAVCDRGVMIQSPCFSPTSSASRPYCDAHPPEDIVQGLRAMVERFEQAAMDAGVQKIKTIGDAFMAAAGLFRPTENAVLDCVRCGTALVTAAAEVAPQWPIRVGIHAGSVIGGVVGARQYLFDIWGDTVNTAARVEHNGAPMRVTLSAVAWSRIAHCCRGASRGSIDLKGKGGMEFVQFEGFT